MEEKIEPSTKCIDLLTAFLDNREDLCGEEAHRVLDMIELIVKPSSVRPVGNIEVPIIVIEVKAHFGKVSKKELERVMEDIKKATSNERD